MGRSVPSAPPQDITCTSPSSTSLLVSWAPPPLEFQNGIITGYTIQYSTTEGNKTSKRVEGIPPERSPYLLENLEKWAEYGVTVRAQTQAGDGPESLQLLIRTEEDGMFLNKRRACLRIVRPTNNGCVYLTNTPLVSSEHLRLMIMHLRATPPLPPPLNSPPGVPSPLLSTATSLFFFLQQLFLSSFSSSALPPHL